VRVRGRRHDQRRRVLGVPQHGVQSESPRCLPDRGQRLRHLGARRSEHGRRQHLEARGVDAWTAHSGSGRLRPGRQLRGHEQSGGICARASRTGARARARDPSVFALAVGSGNDVPAPEERDADAARDPLVTFPRWLVAEGHITEQELEALKAEVDAEILAATDDALAQPQPTADTVLYGVYSPDVDPTSEQFDTEDDPKFTGEPTTMVDLLNVCIKDEMHRDGKILVFGEDVADVSRAQYLDKVKGKGGVFKVTWGLQKEFGGDRVYNSPLAEANI